MKNKQVLIPVIIIVLVVVVLLINNGGKKQSAEVNPSAPPAQTASQSTPQAATNTTVDASGYTVSPTGLKFKDIEIGTGSEAVKGSTVSIEYTGRLEDGKVFDSTGRHGNKPFRFMAGNQEVVPGMDEGVLGMKVGGSRELIIPPDLGYGEDGAGPIPENATLIFKIKLVDVQ